MGSVPVVSLPDCPQVSGSAGMAALKQLNNADESNVRSISCGRRLSQVRGDHLKGHSEGQNGAGGSSPELVIASVSWFSCWPGHVLPGRGMPEGFMACKRPGVRVPLAPRFRRSKAICADLDRLLIVQEVMLSGELA